MDLDHLWASSTSPKGWLYGCTPEQREWAEAVAAGIGERGREPIWVLVAADFKKRWPDTKPPTAATLAKHVRSLVDD